LGDENNNYYMSVRDYTVDFVKGALMWCVVYGHTVDALCGGLPHSSVWLHCFVRTFDLPFFMVISGYFLKCSLSHKPWWSVVSHRLTLLLVPIVIWTLLRGHINIFSGMYYFLWAVLASSMICVIAHLASSFFGDKTSKIFEPFLLVSVIFLLYMVKVPWNLFYLFPFFVVGYYLKNLKFELSMRWFRLAVFVFSIGLCFWSPLYTPWRLGPLAWKDNSLVVGIYVYRTILALVGIIVMSYVFRVCMLKLEKYSFVRDTLVSSGRETLAIYILQSIVIERIMRKLCRAIIEYYSYSFSEEYINFIGYVVALIVSFLSLWGLLMVIRSIKKIPVLKYSFGF
jgi:fucose 4-O-acetylase-like acetyltransferase